MPTHKYVTDIQNYRGPVEDISPHHLYQYLYWSLRGKWRTQLYAWTRRDFCDASVSLQPKQVVAGMRETVTLTVKIGETSFKPGGRIAVYFPMTFGGDAQRAELRYFQGPDGQTGYGHRITAKGSREDVVLCVQVHSTGSIFTCVEVILEEGELGVDDTIDIVIGDPSCKLPIINEKAKSYPFRIAIDYEGNDQFLPIRQQPSVQVVGGRPVQFRCYAPASPTPGKPFRMRIVASDLTNHNPAYFYEGEVKVKAASGELEGTCSLSFPGESHGTYVVPDLQVTNNGVTRIQVIDEKNGLTGLSNPICPEIAPEGFSVYYGEIHSHTDISDGVGSPEESFLWARDVEGLDFAALADHFEDGQSYNYTLEKKWEITKEITEKFNDPGNFVSLLGYEIGTVEKHRNVYFSDGEGRMIVEGPEGETVTMDNVFSKLENTDYILIPHAPKFHGIDWHCPHNPETQRLVEICSYWGVSEEGDYTSVRHGLDLGYKFGFTGGTDNHVAEAGNPDQGGITGVYATGLTRNKIFEALKARRTFATTGPRMTIRIDINRAFMGSDLFLDTSVPREITGRVLTCDPIAQVEIIRNGVSAYSVDGNGSLDISLEWLDVDPLTELTPERELTNERFVYYYLRVKTVYGDLGWSSPIWVHCPE